MKSLYIIIFLFLFSISSSVLSSQDYKIVDTGQDVYYDNKNEIPAIQEGNEFYGQDASYNGHQPSYTDNGDGTITDNITGLMWSKTPDLEGDGDIDYDDKLSYEEALKGAETFDLAGYNDWRLPSIKELYSLIMFYGLDPSGQQGSSDNFVPFINTDYFDFAYGDEDAGERAIDAQFATTSIYTGTIFNGDQGMFGVNFADGRIKGYPTGPMPGQSIPKQFYVLYVRGNENYGQNDFVDNGNGTITDNATGLMWMQDDNGVPVLWQDALAYAENFEFAGYNDWRLPNVKELESIVDYSRSPDATNSAAIDLLFNVSTITDEGDNEDYPFYWSSTTHANMSPFPGANAAYVAFGKALGWMEMPPMSGNYNLLDVHGAGAQRSDPKTGNPDDYPHGFGPQGDVIRIYNYVRLVRDVQNTGVNEDKMKDEINIYPNPAGEVLNIASNDLSKGKIVISNSVGQKMLEKTFQPGGVNHIELDDFISGIYSVVIRSGNKFLYSKFIKK